MDIVEATSDFQDWEVLHTNSDSASAPINSPDSGNSFDEIDSGGLVQANYFSLQSQERSVERVDDDKSVESDNPSWIDPGLEEDPTRYLNKDSGGFWSDSSSEQSQDIRYSGFERMNEMGFCENEMKVEGIRELHEEKGKLAEDFDKIHMDSGIDTGSVDNYQVDVKENVLEAVGEEKNENGEIVTGERVVDDVGNKRRGEPEKKSLAWWKMPVQFLKYFVLRMSPVWTVAVAAAFMGVVILGRRLYKMKKKTRGYEIKVTVDDQKVSQVMSRAARLNEAFSVVKWVPVIRPALPAVGSTSTWPAMSMRSA